jgi:hypothetical protein
MRALSDIMKDIDCVVMMPRFIPLPTALKLGLPQWEALWRSSYGVAKPSGKVEERGDSQTKLSNCNGSQLS